MEIKKVFYNGIPAINSKDCVAGIGEAVLANYDRP